MDESTKSKLFESRTWIREELERCIGFWLNNGMDPVNGGVYTCLDREGKSFPRIRVSGCRGAAAGSSPGCAICTA